MKVIKYIGIILVVGSLVYMCFASTEVYATFPSLDELFQKAGTFLNKGAAQPKLSATSIAALISPVASVLLGIGTAVLIAVGAVMGIKYMTASPDAQAKLKGQLIGLVVATIVLYGAYGIWGITYRIFFSMVG